jgi:hypothetical protein
MNKKLLTVLLSLLMVFLLVIGGAIYYASTLLKPEEIRRMAQEQLQEVFPNANIEIGEISLKFGLSTRLRLTKLEMALREGVMGKEIPLFGVEDLGVRIPVWAILRGKGTVEVSLVGPRLHYHQVNEDTNWFKALGDESPNDKNQERKAGRSSEDSGATGAAIALPAFLLMSELNLKIRDLNISYVLDEMSGEVGISRFVIKNLNFLSPSGYEVDSNVKLSFGEDNNVEFDTLIIGEFDVSKLISQEDFLVRSMVRVVNLRATSLPNRIQEIRLDVDSIIKSSGDVTVNSKGEMGNTRFSAQVKMNDEGMFVEQFKVDMYLDEKLKLFDIKMPELNVGRARFIAEGDIAITDTSGIVPAVDFKLEPNISYTLNNVAIGIGTSGSFKRDQLATNLTLEAFSGTIITRINGVIDPNMKEFDLAKLNPFDIAVSINNMRISKEYIQTLLYSEAPEQTSATASAQEEEVAAAAVPIVLPRSVINLSINHFFLADQDIVGEGRFIVGKDSITTERLNFNYSQGRGELTHTTRLRSDSRIANTFGFQMHGLNLSGIDAFLPPMLKGIAGTFSGSFRGKADLLPDGELTYDVDVDVSARNGELRGLNLSEQINEIASGLPMIKDRLPQGKAYEFDEKFESLIFKGKLTDKRYNFNTFEFKGIQNKVEVKGSGHLIPPPHVGRSELVLTVMDHSGKVGPLMERHVGTNVLPVRLRGEGFALMPDLEYTLGRVAKSAVRTQVRERVEQSGVVQKAEERVQQEKERVQEQIKDQGRQQIDRLLRRR